jgi:hypothetical protein
MDFFAEFWLFLWTRKKFWLWPVIIMMLVFGSLFVVLQGSPIAPFIYALF